MKKVISNILLDYEWDLENVTDRGEMIAFCLNFFGDQQMLVKTSDSLIYVFNNISEAISWVIYRIKEIDYKGDITYAALQNAGDLGEPMVYIKDEHGGWCQIKPLNSYRYNDSNRRVEEYIKTMYVG